MDMHLAITLPLLCLWLQSSCCQDDRTVHCEDEGVSSTPNWSLPCLPMCVPFQFLLLSVQLCWCLFIDVVCLSDDGCLFDAVVLAVMVALKKCQFMEVPCSCG